MAIPQDPLPLAVSIPGGLSPDRFIVIDGKVAQKATVFSTKLQCGPSMADTGDIPLCIDFHFDNNTAKFTANSYLNREWGTPKNRNSVDIQATPKKGVVIDDERSEGDIPLRRGEYCGLVLECHETHFRITVRSEEICTFNHRSDFTLINYLVLTGDFSVSQAGVAGGMGPTRWLIHASGFYMPWQQHFVIVLTDEMFESQVIASSEDWLVLFYMDHCDFHSPWELAAQDLVGKINFAVIDVLVNIDTALRLKLTVVPTIVYYPGGNEKDWGTFQMYDGEYTQEGFIKWALHQLNKEHNEAPGAGPTPAQEPIHMIEKDSWKKGPPNCAVVAWTEQERVSLAEKNSGGTLTYHDHNKEEDPPDGTKTERTTVPGAKQNMIDQVHDNTIDMDDEQKMKSLQEPNTIQEKGPTETHSKNLAEKKELATDKLDELKRVGSHDTVVLKSEDANDEDSTKNSELNEANRAKYAEASSSKSPQTADRQRTLSSEHQITHSILKDKHRETTHKIQPSVSYADLQKRRLTVEKQSTTRQPEQYSSVMPVVGSKSATSIPKSSRTNLKIRASADSDSSLAAVVHRLDKGASKASLAEPEAKKHVARDLSDTGLPKGKMPRVSRAGYIPEPLDSSQTTTATPDRQPGVTQRLCFGEICLQDEVGRNVALLLRYYFRHNHWALNSEIDEEWGEEEIHINDVFITNYSHRLAYQLLTKLLITGPVYLKCVAYEASPAELRVMLGVSPEQEEVNEKQGILRVQTSDTTPTEARPPASEPSSTEMGITPGRTNVISSDSTTAEENEPTLTSTSRWQPPGNTEKITENKNATQTNTNTETQDLSGKKIKSALKVSQSQVRIAPETSSASGTKSVLKTTLSERTLTQSKVILSEQGSNENTVEEPADLDRSQMKKSVTFLGVASRSDSDVRSEIYSPTPESAVTSVTPEQTAASESSSNTHAYTSQRPPEITSSVAGLSTQPEDSKPASNLPSKKASSDRKCEVM